MTLFEQFIVTYFISAAALACFAVLWRNWLEDHPNWKMWLANNLGAVAKAMTCGSCFTAWITLLFVLIFNPLNSFLISVVPFANIFAVASYAIQWMALGWGALTFRFFYVALQEAVSIMVHKFEDQNHKH